jgi:hypothetical protein
VGLDEYEIYIVAVTYLNSINSLEYSVQLFQRARPGMSRKIYMPSSPSRALSLLIDDIDLGQEASSTTRGTMDSFKLKSGVT